MASKPRGHTPESTRAMERAESLLGYVSNTAVMGPSSTNNQLVSTAEKFDHPEVDDRNDSERYRFAELVIELN